MSQQPTTVPAAPAYARGRRRRAGLTLIELLTTLALAAILVTLGVPAFNELMARYRLTTAVNALLADLQLARSEALRRGIPVALCSGGAGGPGFACGGGDWHAGYLVFTDADGDLAVDGAAEVLRVTGGEAGAHLRIQADRQGIAFLTDGTAAVADEAPATWTFCPLDSRAAPRQLSVSRSGRATVSEGRCD